MPKKINGKLLVVPALFLFLAAAVPSAFAAVSVTPATGGSAISADTTGGSYTALTGPVISEGVSGDIGKGTIILNVPAGFVFDTGGTAPTVLVTRTSGSGPNGNNINKLASGKTIAVTVAATTLTITITQSTSHSVTNSLTWQNVRVRPSAGTPLASGTITESGTAVISGVTSATNFGTLTEVAGAAAQFALNDPGNVYAKTRLGYTVSRKDQYGNTATSGTTTAYLYTSSLSSSAKFYSDSLAGSQITSVAMGSGQSSANFWYYDETAGTYTITASDNASAPDGNTGIKDATDAVTVMPVATKFVILQPSNGTVDNPITVTVQAQEPDGTVDTNYQNDVTLNVSGSATGGGLVNIVNGVGTASIADTVAATVTLTLTDSQSTGLDVSSSQTVVFSQGALAQFSFTGSASSVSAGNRAAYVVARQDQYGNAITSGTTTAYLYSSSLSASKKFYDASSGGSALASITIPDGQSQVDFWYYDETAGTYTITASDNASAPDGNTNVNDAMGSLVVAAGPTVQFVLNDPGNMTVSTTVGYTVSREDQFGNAVTAGSDAAYLYTSSLSPSAHFYSAASGGTSISVVTIGNGQSSANFWYYDDAVGTYTITASDNASAPDGTTGIKDGTDSITVNAAPVVATRFVMLQPLSGTVDAPVTVTVQAQDGSGNVDTSYQNDVTLVVASPGIGGGLIDIVNGVGTASVSSKAAQLIALSLSDTQSTGLNVSAVGTISFAAGATAQFTLNNPGDTAAGVRIGYVLIRKDQYGNAVTNGSDAAYLYSSSLSASKKFYDASSGGSALASITIPDGQSQVDFWYYDETAGTYTITASDNASAPDGNTGITDATVQVVVQPASVARFIINNPGDMTADTRLGYTVQREDAFGNLVTAGVNVAYLYSSASTSAQFFGASSGGSQITLVPINDGQSQANFWYYATAPGTWTVTVSDNTSAPDGNAGIQDDVDSVTVSAIPIVATRFVILASPSTAVINTAVTVSVQAQDGSGNIDTTYQNDVSLNVSGSATGGGLVSIVNGVGTKQVTDAVAETVDLTLTDSQSTGLDVSSAKAIVFSATAVVQSGGGAAQPIVVIKGVKVSGVAFAGADVKVLSVGKDQAQKDVHAAANGTFSLAFSNLSSGDRSYAVSALDKNGRMSQIKILDANLTDSNSQIALGNVLLSPTLGLVRTTITRGDFVGLIGYAVPGYAIKPQIDGVDVSGNFTAGQDGSYKILINTAKLEVGSHVAKVKQVSPSGVASDFALQKAFNVTNLFVTNTDFNGDGVINIQDWSVFLSRWFSPDPNLKKLDDLNGDGKVDVSDFSIFARTLKI